MEKLNHHLLLAGNHMHDIMLFGDGWTGQVRQIEQGQRVYEYIPHPNEELNLRRASFIVREYRSQADERYLIGHVGNEPLMADIEIAILRNRPEQI